jgi:hypothetical protein
VRPAVAQDLRRAELKTILIERSSARAPSAAFLDGYVHMRLFARAPIEAEVMAIFPEQKYGPVSSKMLLSDGVAIWTAARSGSLNGALRLRIMKATWATETNVAFQVSRFSMTSGFSRGPRLLNKY